MKGKLLSVEEVLKLEDGVKIWVEYDLKKWFIFKPIDGAEVKRGACLCNESGEHCGIESALEYHTKYYKFTEEVKPRFKVGDVVKFIKADPKSDITPSKYSHLLNNKFIIEKILLEQKLRYMLTGILDLEFSEVELEEVKETEKFCLNCNYYELEMSDNPCILCGFGCNHWQPKQQPLEPIIEEEKEMKKEYKAWEILKMIEDGELKIGDKVVANTNYEFYISETETLRYSFDKKEVMGSYFTSDVRYTIPTQNPVTFIEAVKAYSEGKVVICKTNGREDIIYNIDKNRDIAGMTDNYRRAVSHNEILNGEWFIKA